MIRFLQKNKQKILNWTSVISVAVDEVFYITNHQVYVEH